MPGNPFALIPVQQALIRYERYNLVVNLTVILQS